MKKRDYEVYYCNYDSHVTCEMITEYSKNKKRYHKGPYFDQGCRSEDDSWGDIEDLINHEDDYNNFLIFNLNRVQIRKIALILNKKLETDGW